MNTTFMAGRIFVSMTATVGPFMPGITTSLSRTSMVPVVALADLPGLFSALRQQHVISTTSQDFRAELTNAGIVFDNQNRLPSRPSDRSR